MEQKTQPLTRRRLRSVLIHKPMQREFTLIVIGTLFVSALAIGVVIHSTIQEAMMGGGYRFGKISPYEVMSDLSYDLIVRISLVLFMTILVIAAFGIFFLHRIAGPVYRFQVVLRRILQGEVPEEFQLREGDFFKETADDLNQVIRMLSERRGQIQGLRKKLEQAVRGESRAGSETLLLEVKEVIDQLG